MKIFCPIHPTEPLHQLQFHALNQEKAKQGARRGTLVRIDLQYCVKCNKAYKPKVSFE